MNRDEFEKAYVSRHMQYDPRNEKSKLQSVIRLRLDDGYTDSHIDLCWSVQKVLDGVDSQVFFTTNYRKTLKSQLRW